MKVALWSDCCWFPPLWQQSCALRNLRLGGLDGPFWPHRFLLLFLVLRALTTFPKILTPLRQGRRPPARLASTPSLLSRGGRTKYSPPPPQASVRTCSVRTFIQQIAFLCQIQSPRPLSRAHPIKFPSMKLSLFPTKRKKACSRALNFVSVGLA